MRGGLVTEIRAVSDRLGMFLQLGWDWPARDLTGPAGRAQPESAAP